MPCDVLHRIGAERRTIAGGRVKCDVVLARLATGQSGVVGRAQLASIGYSRREIELLVTARRLIRLHRGVYAVGHEALSERGRVIAALIAVGQGAVASHWTAAAIWRLLPSMPPFVDVTLTDRRPRQRDRIRIHHASSLETTGHGGIAITTPRQTLQQLKGPDADRATSEALYLGLIDRSDAPQDEPTRSELERKLLPMLAAAGLPRPLVNHRLGRYTIDFLWPEQKLAVEADGWAGHGHRVAFERDRSRDADLQAQGFAVLRFTWRQVLHETLQVTVRVAQLLSRTPHSALTTPPAGG